MSSVEQWVYLSLKLPAPTPQKKTQQNTQINSGLNPESQTSAMGSYWCLKVPTFYLPAEMALWLSLCFKKKIFSIISFYKKLILETAMSLNIEFI